MGFAQTAALGGMSTCTEELVAAADFFPRYFAERPPMKSSEGRHYRNFLQEGEVQVGRQFPSILVTFCSLGVLLGPFGGSPGPGPHFL